MYKGRLNAWGILTVYYFAKTYIKYMQRHKIVVDNFPEKMCSLLCVVVFFPENFNPKQMLVNYIELVLYENWTLRRRSNNLINKIN